MANVNLYIDIFDVRLYTMRELRSFEMAFFGLFKPRSQWTVHYTVEQRYNVTNLNVVTGQTEPCKDPEIVTFFLKEDQYGNRKVEHTDYGVCAERKAYKRHSAEMKLWIEAGILPVGAKNVLMEKLKKTS